MSGIFPFARQTISITPGNELLNQHPRTLAVPTSRSGNENLQAAMSSDNKQMILIVVPTVAAILLCIVIAIVLIYKHRHNSQKNLLPISAQSQPANPQQSFVQRHLEGIRSWSKPAPSQTDRLGQPLKTDPRHLSLSLAQPSSSHQPTRKVKGSYALYQERQAKKQEQRDREAGRASEISGNWPFQPMEKPKPRSYWAQVGRETEARRTWWDKLRDKIGM